MNSTTDGPISDVEREESERIAVIRNRLGLHARPAAEFVKLASHFDADVWIEKDGLEVNGKSILGVMMLAAEAGSEVRIRTLGEDAAQAAAELVALVDRGFGEELDPSIPSVAEEPS